MTDRDTLAAKHFPKEWALVATKPGASKKRQQLRQRAEHVEIVEGLRGKGACCATCDGFGDLPKATGLRYRHYCAADSDFHGYVEAHPDGLCHRWLEKK